MEIKLVNNTPDADEMCGKIACICYDTPEEKWERVLRKCLKDGHTSVIEHAAFTFYIENVSRVFLAQITRHRLASFTVRSGRYCDNSDTVFIIPDSIYDNEEARELAAQVIDHCFDTYDQLKKIGIPAGDARFVLPEALGVSMYVTMNARELLHFCELRCCNRAQWEIREAADKMAKLAKEAAPIIFENVGAPCQIGKTCPTGSNCKREKL